MEFVYRVFYQDVPTVTRLVLLHMVHQEQQKEVFNILFTIFITVYTIIFTFIKTTFKFIGIIAIVPAKGLLGMLGLFYSNSKSTKKGEESK